MAVLKRKTWIVDCQPPPAEFQGPQAVIGYLVNYVAGTCYAGLYTPAGREQRLELARELIARQKQGLSQRTLQAPGGEPPEQEPQADRYQEKVPCKTCSRCQANMDALGMLRGRETLRIIQLAEDIDQRLTERVPLLRLEMMAVVMDLLQRVWRLRDLPTPVRGLLRGIRLDTLERWALKTLLERRLPYSMQLPKANHKPHTSGVPPPEYLDEVIRDTQ